MGEQERALRQFQRMLLAEPDERLAEIGRLANEVRELRQQNRDLAAELVDAKVRPVACLFWTALRCTAVD